MLDRGMISQLSRDLLTVFLGTALSIYIGQVIVTGASPHLGYALLGFVALFIALKRPDWMWIGVFVVHHWFLPSPFPNFSMERLMAAIILMGWALQVATHQWHLEPFPRTIVIGSALYLVAVVMSIGAGLSYGTVWLTEGLLFWVNRLLILFLMYQTLRTQQQVLNCIYDCLAFILFLAFMAVIIYPVVTGELSPRLELERFSFPPILFGRALGAVNGIALLFSFGIILWWGFGWLNRSSGRATRSDYFITVIITLMIVAGIVGYTGSRSGTLMMFISLIYASWVAVRSRQTRGRLLLLWIVVILAVTVVGGFTFGRLQLTFVDPNLMLSSRRPQWDLVLSLIPEKPLFGWGTGVSMIITESVREGGVTIAQSWLQTLLETGLFGLFTYLILFLGLGWHIWKQFRSLRFGDIAYVRAGAFVAIWGVIFLLHNLTGAGHLWTNYYLIGLGLAYLRTVSPSTATTKTAETPGHLTGR